MPVVASGRIVIWEGASLWLLSGASNTAEVRHTHHAIQITFQLAGAYEIGLSDSRVSGPVSAVGSDVPHTFRASGAVAFLFVAPESAAGRAIGSAFPGEHGWADLSAPLAGPLADLRRAHETKASEVELLEIGQQLIARLHVPDRAALPDPRVTAMIDYARARLADDITLTLAASHVCLSESRARHLFAMHTGLPFKSYLLWLRLQHALAAYVQGGSLTEAAHDAGFADSAHLSRTFKRTFGLPANHLRLGSPAASAR
ncbi:MAG: helix-turn-helix transcriptional regulator [Sphingomonadales bacterium]|nr:helix-turn-helix transcriptional regulator [Sphingomonadales bacterium]